MVNIVTPLAAGEPDVSVRSWWNSYRYWTSETQLQMNLNAALSLPDTDIKLMFAHKFANI